MQPCSGCTSSKPATDYFPPSQQHEKHLARPVRANLLVDKDADDGEYILTVFGCDQMSLSFEGELAGCRGAVRIKCCVVLHSVTLSHVVRAGLDLRSGSREQRRHGAGVDE